VFDERTYAFGSSTLTLRFADILNSPAEVLVSSDDFMLSMGGGVSRALAEAAGNAMVLDAAKSVPRHLGDVVVTTAGALNARYIFHVVTIGSWEDKLDDSGAEEVVRRATSRCLDIVDALDVTSITFPALGTGAAGFSMEAAAAAMADIVAEHLQTSARKLQVSLYFRARTGMSERQYIAFFEEFARRQPNIANKSAPGAEAPERPTAIAEPLSQLLTLERERQRLEQDIVVLRATKESASADALSQQLVENQEKRLDVAAREWVDRDRPVSIFVSYAHEDEQFRDKLLRHLSTLQDLGLVQTWHDRLISPGTNWDKDINKAIDLADVLILLVSSDFVASGYIRSTELTRAFERLQRGEVTVIPVLVRTVDLVGSRLSTLQWLPTGGKPIKSWNDEDEAYVDVVAGIRRAVEVCKRTRRGLSAGARASSHSSH
jgi:O-acetyl-ADP-ribose deacetylase (regulator of RNase III)